MQLLCQFCLFVNSVRDEYFHESLVFFSFAEKHAFLYLCGLLNCFFRHTIMQKNIANYGLYHVAYFVKDKSLSSELSHLSIYLGIFNPRTVL